MVSSASSPAVLLIVADDALLRALPNDTARDAGLICLEASSTDEAIQFLATRADIGIVFIDIEMSGSRSGLNLARRIGEQWPSIGVIVSGTQTPTSKDFPLRGHFLPKPYDGGQLLRVLRLLAS